jgi:hypothetical protein
MILMDVQVVSDDSSQADGWAQSIADVTGRVFQLAEGQVATQIRFVDPCHYAESGIPPFSTPKPVMIRLTCDSLPESPKLEIQTRQLANEISSILHLPLSWVYLCYDTPAAGRISIGGEM